MQEVVDVGFLPVRGAHAVVLSHMETGRLSWDQRGAPADLRRMYVSRTPAAALSPGGHSKVVSSISKIPCIAYNKGTCTKSAEHTSKTGKVSHICLFCQSEGKLHRHPEIKCRSKTKWTDSLLLSDEMGSRMQFESFNSNKSQLDSTSSFKLKQSFHNNQTYGYTKTSTNPLLYVSNTCNGFFPRSPLNKSGLWNCILTLTIISHIIWSVKE